ncbi:hypothetical protein [Photobacterium damselae]
MSKVIFPAIIVLAGVLMVANFISKPCAEGDFLCQPTKKVLTNW